ncbi:MAG TPA: SRPBCC family protein [Acidimicrobiales bacterium]
MDVTAELMAPCTPEMLFGWVDDLGRYPDWLEIVPLAIPVDEHPDDAGPAWSVDLRGQLGPFARSKRLRMVRTVHEPSRLVQFERIEHDQRQHSAWVLRAEVTEADDGGSLLTMHLHYGGALGGAVVEKLLADEITKSRPRLLDRLQAAT